MSEKRFKGYAEKTGQHHILIINDEIGEEYSITDDFFKSQDVIFEIVDLLNVMNDTLLKQAKENHKLSNENVEQQATIKYLTIENRRLNEKYDYDIEDYRQSNAELKKENEQLKQEIKQYWKCRDKWKQEAKELKKEADYFERKKCEYWNMYNEAHSDRIILKKENEELRQKLDFYLLDEFEWKEKYGDGV